MTNTSPPTNTAEIADAIASWEPPATTDTSEGTLAWARDLVAAAGPRDPREAKAALRCLFAYGEHLAQAGEALCAGALAADRVDRYRDEILTGPKGTRDATASYLKRLHPDIGLAGTTRKSRTAETRAHEPSPDDAPDEPEAVLAPEVNDAIEAFTPTLLPRDRWLPIAELCRTAVRAANPTTAGRARDLCRSTAYLAAFTHANHQPLRIDVVLAAKNIEALVDVLARSLPDRSAATHSSNLHALRDAHGLPLDVPRRRFPKPGAKDPYTSEELDRLFHQAARIPTRRRRRHVHAALHLVLGAGASPSEALAARPEHIASSPSGATVEIAGRRVEVLADYADALLAAADAAREAGDSHLLGGSGTTRANRFSELFTARRSGNWAVNFDSTRGRATFIVEAALDTARYPGTLDLLDAAGLETFAVITDLLPAIRARRAERTSPSHLQDQEAVS